MAYFVTMAEANSGADYDGWRREIEAGKFKKAVKVATKK